MDHNIIDDDRLNYLTMVNPREYLKCDSNVSLTMNITVPFNGDVKDVDVSIYACVKCVSKIINIKDRNFRQRLLDDDISRIIVSSERSDYVGKIVRVDKLKIFYTPDSYGIQDMINRIKKFMLHVSTRMPIDSDLATKKYYQFLEKDSVVSFDQVLLGDITEPITTKCSNDLVPQSHHLKVMLLLSLIQSSKQQHEITKVVNYDSSALYIENSHDVRMKYNQVNCSDYRCVIIDSRNQDTIDYLKKMDATIICKNDKLWKQELNDSSYRVYYKNEQMKPMSLLTIKRVAKSLSLNLRICNYENKKFLTIM